MSDPSDELAARVDRIAAKARRPRQRQAERLVDVAQLAAHDDSHDEDISNMDIGKVESSKVEGPRTTDHGPSTIPAHLRAYMVAPPADSLIDYGDHAARGPDGEPRYPGGRCGRPDCRPCRLAALDAGTGQDWAGLARMARARRSAGFPLNELETESLRRAGVEDISPA